MTDSNPRKCFSQEVAVMRVVGDHEHIVRYVGSVTLELGPALMMEHCELGDLLSFLRQTLKHAKTEVLSVK